MKGLITFSEVPHTSVVRWQKINDFLQSVDLDVSLDVELFIVAKQDDHIVACAGLSGRVLKNIAIDETVRGRGIALRLMSELLKVAYREKRSDLFLFTKPIYQEMFEDCGFKYIEQSNHEVILMENSHNIEHHKETLRTFKKEGNRIGSIVINANPFTLGHAHLVEQACLNSDWVHLFVVREDVSFFSFKDRYHLIQEGLKHIPNLTIYKGSDYIISKATFPTYFIKDKCHIDSLYTELDLNIFRNHLAPQLGITHRFVGEEPICVVTNEYNQQMKKILSSPSNHPSIEVIEISRIEYKGEPISASRVRRLMGEKNLEEISHLVPSPTYQLIEKMLSNTIEEK